MFRIVALYRFYVLEQLFQAITITYHQYKTKVSIMNLKDQNRFSIVGLFQKMGNGNSAIKNRLLEFPNFEI